SVCCKAVQSIISPLRIARIVLDPTTLSRLRATLAPAGLRTRSTSPWRCAERAPTPPKILQPQLRACTRTPGLRRIAAGKLTALMLMSHAPARERNRRRRKAEFAPSIMSSLHLQLIHFLLSRPECDRSREPGRRPRSTITERRRTPSGPFE